MSFSIGKPNGQTGSGSAATDSRGYATYKLRTRSKDPAGTWLVTATMLKNGSTAGASTTFTVQ